MRLDLSRLTKPPARRLAGDLVTDRSRPQQPTPANPASGGDRGASEANTGEPSPKLPEPSEKTGTSDGGSKVDGNQTIVPEPEVIEPWRQKIIDMLGTDPLRKYAMIVDNITTDPVMISIGIRPIGTFQMAIPLHNYDPFKLMELIEKHAQRADPNAQE